MISFFNRLINPHPRLVIPSIEFESSQLEKVPTFDDGFHDFNLIVVEKWKLSVGEKQYELTYKDHPNGQVAELNGAVVPTELALLCFDAFFDQNNMQITERLLSELKRYQ